VSVSNCSMNHPTNSHKRIFLIPIDTIPVSSASKQENKQGRRHHDTRDSKSKGPTEVILDVDHHDES